MQNKTNHRFDALDGIRGILAITVVIYHLGQHKNLDFINKAWISVDAFYILSGFVIAFFYGKKIEDGLSLREFMSLRLQRLYPIYFIGLLIAIAYPPPFLQVTHNEINLTFIKQFFLALLLIPDLETNPNTYNKILFPLNDPAWSLFFEIIVNVLFYFWVKNKKYINPSMTIGVPLFLYGLSAYLSSSGFHGGWSSDNFMTGFPRVIYHFSIGVFISTLFNKNSKFKTNAPSSIVILLILLISFFIKNSAITSVSLIIICPLLIFTGSFLAVQNPFKITCSWLGAISYPIYITHYPLMRFFDEIIITRNPIIYILISTISCIILATFLSKLEIEIRKRLTSIIK
jgi:peptidoglycan/LPS O-acetylase OafA/YrhL